MSKRDEFVDALFDFAYATSRETEGHKRDAVQRLADLVFPDASKPAPQSEPEKDWLDSEEFRKGFIHAMETFRGEWNSTTAFELKEAIRANFRKAKA